MKVEGKAALVTGGARGLGKAYTKILLQHGAKVLFTDINQEQGETTLSEFKTDYGQDNVTFCKADVTSDTDMQDAFKKAKDTFGRLDIVVNNAGIVNELDPLWEKCILVNMTGAIRGTRLALSYLRKDQGGEGGVIINCCSSGALGPFVPMPVYSGTKAGLLMYSRAIAADPEVTENGVRVNTLCPAAVDTEMVKTATTFLPASKNEMFVELANMFGKMTVDYVAECMYELVTDDSKNGAALTMSKDKGKTYVSFPDDA